MPSDVKRIAQIFRIMFVEGFLYNLLRPVKKNKPGNTKLSMLSLNAAIIPKMSVRSSMQMAAKIIAERNTKHT